VQNNADMQRKLDVGATLNQVFSTYGAQAGTLLPVAFGLYLLVAIVSALLTGSLILLPIVTAVGIIAATLYQGMVVSLVRDVQDGQRDSSVGELIEEVAPVVLPLIGAGILAGIGIGIGLILLIVPGLILMTIWAVIAPVIVVEHSGVIDAFGRSRELVRDHGWQVFGVIVVVFLIVFVVGLILSLIGAAVSDTVVMRAVFSLIANTLTAPLTALTAATIYFNLLAIKGEGAPPAAGYGEVPPPPAPGAAPPPAAPGPPPPAPGPPPPPAPPAPPAV
jgi:hypothetical protein